MTNAECKDNIEKQEEIRENLLAEVEAFKNIKRSTLTVSFRDFLKDGLIHRKK